MMITLATAGILGLIYLGLAANVSNTRRTTGVNVGDGAGGPQTEKLVVAMRIHANFAEYVPLALILLAGIEIGGGGHAKLVILAIILVLSRIVHPFGMMRPAPNAYRMAGIAGTWIVILLASLWALLLAL